ncbi:MAG: retropepsin-like aspartic protease family protein [Burkholderiaceae bacterium]
MRSISVVFSTLLFSNFGFAADISVVGIFPGKAVLVIEGGNPKTYSVGNTVADNTKLVEVNESSATFEENGKRRTIAFGEHFNHASPSGPAQVTLQSNGQGHYITQGQINGGTVTMMVDTGASMIALPASDAIRLGINYKKGQIAYVNTANGAVPAYRVTLNTVKVGDIEINQVSALVQETGLPIILLGMSFLNRTDMHSENGQMLISKRY